MRVFQNKLEKYPSAAGMSSALSCERESRVNEIGNKREREVRGLFAAENSGTRSNALLSLFSDSIINVG